jgi:hypothetical protein
MRSTIIFGLLFGASVVFAAKTPPPPVTNPDPPSYCDTVLVGNIVTNCGFETGDFTGWTLTNTNATFVASNFDEGPNSGTYFAALGNVGFDGSVAQTLSTVAGQTYTFQFFLASDGGLPNDFTAQWDGTTLLALTNTPATAYVPYTFTVTGTGSDTINFLERNDPSYWGLDDVSVVASTATPEPSSLFGSFLLLGLLAGCGAVYKRRKVQNS